MAGGLYSGEAPATFIVLTYLSDARGSAFDLEVSFLCHGQPRDTLMMITLLVTVVSLRKNSA